MIRFELPRNSVGSEFGKDVISLKRSWNHYFSRFAMAACFFALGAASVHIADAQGNENAWRRFATAKTLSDPNLPEANRQMYVAGMYDAIAGDALLVQFTKDPKERVLAILDVRRILEVHL